MAGDIYVFFLCLCCSWQFPNITGKKEGKRKKTKHKKKPVAFEDDGALTPSPAVSPETEMLTSDLSQSPPVSPDPTSDASPTSGISSITYTMCRIHLAVIFIFCELINMLCMRLSSVEARIIAKHGRWHIRFFFMSVLLMTVSQYYRKERRKAKKDKA